MKESKFQRDLMNEIMHKRLPGSLVLKVETYLQGFPDLLVLYGKRWAALECKRGVHAKHQPNQDFYVKLLNQMSFAAFIYPENKEEVLNELQRSFKAKGATRVSKRKQVSLGQLRR